jgi:hypothetical protein
MHHCHVRWVANAPSRYRLTPRKYLLTTTLVASWLQNAGTSTSFCSNTVFLGEADAALVAILGGQPISGRGRAARESERGPTNDG